MINIMEEKQQEIVRFRFERRHGEVVFRRFLKYRREGLTQTEILVLMRRMSKRFKVKFVRYWWKEFEIFLS